MISVRIIKVFIWVLLSALIIDLLFIGGIIFFSTQLGLTSVPENRIIFLDVGQGDAILIQTVDQKNILIDGGPNKEIIYKLDQYLPITNRRLDLVILTHPDPDHLNGLIEVLQRLKVNRVVYNGVQDPDPTYLLWNDILFKKQIITNIACGQQKLMINSSTVLDFLWPQQCAQNKDLDDDNQASLAILLNLGGYKFLLTGDIPKEAETALLSNHYDLKADVLKISHHGSKYSSGLDFLRTVKPQYSIISVGKNRFGHPSLRVLKNLEKVNSQVLRTDQDGDIIFYSQNNQWLFKTIK